MRRIVETTLSAIDIIELIRLHDEEYSDAVGPAQDERERITGVVVSWNDNGDGGERDPEKSMGSLRIRWIEDRPPPEGPYR